ncbi:MAG: HupE/UreJ family protein [Methylococcaceae bacterium]|nr:HupE/UreJ family protein [Methylococcaceae bacterium]MDZ4157405.1 HupE/UreJ family protein [Methylococcales bacterium]MDP2391620.1 HupE/UreJ family protein [Methylococcaceae bacterium]MDP3020684.1 HupE/UreJ family protein [Methylococcaceae bacterium]MDP3390431.1 HupE/UreJ family protein [Methylococcaceae bacterium]
MKTKICSVVSGVLLFWCLSAEAHTGAGAVHYFVDGVLHPLQGADHLLVMIAIGLSAAMIGGHALWLLPGIFLVMMMAGAGLHVAGLTINSAETWVALSVLMSSVMVWRQRQLPIAFAASLAALFALIHGYVHAAEAGSSLTSYATGFLLTTAVLHGIGIGMGLLSGVKLTMIRIIFAMACTVVGTSLLAGI